MSRETGRDTRRPPNTIKLSLDTVSVNDLEEITIISTGPSKLNIMPHHLVQTAITTAAASSATTACAACTSLTAAAVAAEHATAAVTIAATAVAALHAASQGHTTDNGLPGHAHLYTAQKQAPASRLCTSHNVNFYSGRPCADKEWGFVELDAHVDIEVGTWSVGFVLASRSKMWHDTSTIRSQYGYAAIVR